MDIDLTAFAEQVQGEVCGDRVAATVNGKRVYLTGRNEDGSVFLNEEGVRLRDAASSSTGAEDTPTRGRGRPRKVRPEDVEEVKSVEDVEVGE